MDQIRDLLENVEAGNALGIEEQFAEIISQKVAERLEEERESMYFEFSEEEELDEEELDELSKKTLGSYIGKAKESSDRANFNAGEAIGKGKSIPHQKDMVTYHKRSKGIHRAVKRLTKENAEAMSLDLSEEELDELSKKTLGSYIGKAARSSTDLGGSAAMSAVMSNAARADTMKTSSPTKKKSFSDKADMYAEMVPKLRAKQERRTKGIQLAARKLTKENAEAMGLELSEEELDELSKKTLGSYIGKAARSSTDLGGSAAMSAVMSNAARADTMKTSSPTKKKSFSDKADMYAEMVPKLRAKQERRTKGIQLAARKLTKENAEAMGLELSEEELDELSKKTLGSYVNKASHDVGRLNRDSSNFDNVSRYHQDNASKKTGSDKAKSTKLSNQYYKHSRDALKKSFKREDGIQTAVKKLTKENAEAMGLNLSEEELDEISRGMAVAYAKKSSDDLGARASRFRTSGSEKSNNHSIVNRSRGLDRAVKRMTKEEVELDEAKGDVEVHYTDRNDKLVKKRFKNDPQGAAENALQKARNHIKKLESTKNHEMKTTAKIVHFNEEVELDEETLDELSKKTLGSYAKKLTKD